MLLSATYTGHVLKFVTRMMSFFHIDPFSTSVRDGFLYFDLGGGGGCFFIKIDTVNVVFKYDIYIIVNFDSVGGGGGGVAKISGGLRTPQTENPCLTSVLTSKIVWC